MQKKLTITLSEQVYEGLRRGDRPKKHQPVIGPLVRPHVLGTDLEAAYRQMAEDGSREFEALEWAEVTIGDVAGGPR